MYVIKDSYDGRKVLEVENYTAVMNWVGDMAKTYNYGIYRTWPAENGNGQYFDIGPRVYLVQEVHEES